MEPGLHWKNKDIQTINLMLKKRKMLFQKYDKSFKNKGKKEDYNKGGRGMDKCNFFFCTKSLCPSLLLQKCN